LVIVGETEGVDVSAGALGVWLALAPPAAPAAD
jgi:hypothetical protein